MKDVGMMKGSVTAITLRPTNYLFHRRPYS